MSSLVGKSTTLLYILEIRLPLFIWRILSLPSLFQKNLRCRFYEHSNDNSISNTLLPVSKGSEVEDTSTFHLGKIKGWERCSGWLECTYHCQGAQSNLLCLFAWNWVSEYRVPVPKSSSLLLLTQGSYISKCQVQGRPSCIFLSDSIKNLEAILASLRHCWRIMGKLFWCILVHQWTGRRGRKKSRRKRK